MALSIWQPWAWLIVHGYKDLEYRTWTTSVRGRIAIHAGLTLDREGEHWVRKHFPQVPLPSLDSLERGGIVGTADLTGVLERSPSPWFAGRYGFGLEHPVPCAFIPLRGRQQFFRVPDHLLAEVA